VKKIVCSLLAAVLLLSCLAGCGSTSSATTSSAPAADQSGTAAAAEPIVWKVQGYTAAGTLYDEYGKNLADSINAMANGRLVIDWYSADSIVSVGEGPTAVRDGILDAVF
jgi:TRAP-type C4-dicarboxylate transport system, periplasmic component